MAKCLGRSDQITSSWAWKKVEITKKNPFWEHFPRDRKVKNGQKADFFKFTKKIYFEPGLDLRAQNASKPPGNPQNIINTGPRDLLFGLRFRTPEYIRVQNRVGPFYKRFKLTLLDPRGVMAKLGPGDNLKS